MLLTPRVVGALAGHPAAAAFAVEVLRVHRRYALEIVASFRLCPFVAGSRGSEADSAFGDFCVVLDRELDVQHTAASALSLVPGVVHLVFPLVKVAPPEF